MHTYIHTYMLIYKHTYLLTNPLPQYLSLALRLNVSLLLLCSAMSRKHYSQLRVHVIGQDDDDDGDDDDDDDDDLTLETCAVTGRQNSFTVSGYLCLPCLLTRVVICYSNRLTLLHHTNFGLRRHLHL